MGKEGNRKAENKDSNVTCKEHNKLFNYEIRGFSHIRTGIEWGKQENPSFCSL